MGNKRGEKSSKSRIGQHMQQWLGAVKSEQSSRPGTADELYTAPESKTKETAEKLMAVPAQYTSTAVVSDEPQAELQWDRDQVIRLVRGIENLKVTSTTLNRIAGKMSQEYGLHSLAREIRQVSEVIGDRVSEMRGAFDSIFQGITLDNHEKGYSDLSWTTEQVLTVGVAEISVAIELKYVAEILNIDRLRVTKLKGRRVFHHRGEVIGVLDLAKRFRSSRFVDKQAGSQRNLHSNNNLRKMVLLACGSCKIALEVDVLYGREYVSIMPLPEYVKGAPEIVGAAILNNGQIALVLDPEQVFNAFKNGNK